MRTIAQRMALLKYNAERCEKSRHARCQCACGGTKHGQPHGAEWIAAQRVRISDEITNEVAARDRAEGRPGLFA